MTHTPAVIALPWGVGRPEKPWEAKIVKYAFWVSGWGGLSRTKNPPKKCGSKTIKIQLTLS